MQNPEKNRSSQGVCKILYTKRVLGILLPSQIKQDNIFVDNSSQFLLSWLSIMLSLVLSKPGAELRLVQTLFESLWSEKVQLPCWSEREEGLTLLEVGVSCPAGSTLLWAAVLLAEQCLQWPQLNSDQGKSSQLGLQRKEGLPSRQVH